MWRGRVGPLDTIRSIVTLVTVSRQCLDAEIARDLALLADSLGVAVAEWPPNGGEWDAGAALSFRAMIDGAGYERRFGAFYVIDDDRLVGSAGFFGPPDAHGELEIGYSICETERRRGFASAAIGALCDSAKAGECRAVRASVRPDNIGSIRALQRSGFLRSEGLDPDGNHVFRMLLQDA